MCCRLYNKGEVMKSTPSKLAEEQFEYAHKKAFELIADLTRDGCKGSTIQTTFMAGAAISASFNDMDKEKFMDGCSKVYDVYKDFGAQADKMIDGMKP